MWIDETCRALFDNRQEAFDAATTLEDAGAHLLTVGPDRRTLEEVFIEAVGEEPIDATDLPSG